MQFKLQLVVVSEDEQQNTIEELAMLDKTTEQLADIGLTLAEAKTILTRLQQHLVECQTQAYVRAHRACGQCGKARRKKDTYPVVFRTLFGKLRLHSSRFYRCRCESPGALTYSPLQELLPEHVAPELRYLETKWASLMSYGLTVKLLKDVLPVDEKLSAETVRTHLFAVAERDEAMLGEEQMFFIEGCQRDWDRLPHPQGPITVGIDGGYVRDWEQKQHHFEVIVGKSIARDGPAKCFGFVQTYDTKSKRRLFEVLHTSRNCRKLWRSFVPTSTQMRL